MRCAKLLIVDNQVVVCKGIQRLLQNTPNVKVVGEARDNEEALQKVKELKPDVALVNCNLPLMNCLQTTSDIRQRFPHVKILLLAIYNIFEPYLARALQAGASGFLSKVSTAEELVSAIFAVLAGNTYLDGVVSSLAPRQGENPGPIPPQHEALTVREREVLQLLAQGKTIHQSAEILEISEKTIENHRTNLSKKLKLHSIAKLTQYAIVHGIISI